MILFHKKSKLEKNAKEIEKIRKKKEKTVSSLEDYSIEEKMLELKRMQDEYDQNRKKEKEENLEKMMEATLKAEELLKDNHSSRHR